MTTNADPHILDKEARKQRLFTKINKYFSDKNFYPENYLSKKKLIF